MLFIVCTTVPENDDPRHNLISRGVFPTDCLHHLSVLLAYQIKHSADRLLVFIISTTVLERHQSTSYSRTTLSCRCDVYALCLPHFAPVPLLLDFTLLFCGRRHCPGFIILMKNSSFVVQISSILIKQCHHFYRSLAPISASYQSTTQRTRITWQSSKAGSSMQRPCTYSALTFSFFTLQVLISRSADLDSTIFRLA